MGNKKNTGGFDLEYLIAGLALISLITSGILYWQQEELLAAQILKGTLIVGILPFIVEIIRAIIKGQFGVDVIAVTAMGGSLVMEQYLAGMMILVMLSGGKSLENYAMKRARRELTSLLEQAPRKAHLKNGDKIIDITITKVKQGDILIIKPGEVVPVDGIITNGTSSIDESALTGESLPVEKSIGATVMSGSVNKDSVLEMRATQTSKESHYERLIALVKQAQESKAPLVRLADRYSGWFTIITLMFAAAAWIISHDPLRLLAVLVVATPCPLILATPIAIVSGMSRAAKNGIIVKNGGALEELGKARTIIFDKTGTLTLGIPEVVEIKSEFYPKEEVLRLAASLDQLSAHVVARALIQSAKKQNITLAYPSDVTETIGDGISGTIKETGTAKEKRYHIGKRSFVEKAASISVPEAIKQQESHLRNEGKIPLYLAGDNDFIGAIYLADTVRPDVKELFAHLRELKPAHIIMLTGDKKEVAERIAREAGITEVESECLPQHKLEIVRKYKQEAPPVVMVGDGVNDAPALAAAHVGIALGHHGATASSESADIVITVDQIERVGVALKIARRTLKVAKQNIITGIGLSVAAMAVASLGYIPPVYGAILQEGIDVVIILSALRVHAD